MAGRPVVGDADRTSIAALICDVATIHGTFTLRSGQVSDTYFDKYLFESDPHLLRGIGLLMVPLIPTETEILCGLEMGGIPVVTMLSQLTGLPAAYLRKRPKDYGTRKYAEGPPLSDRAILLVEDVVSSGGAIVDQVESLRADGIVADRALAVIDRETGGREKLAGIGVYLDALYTRTEIERAARKV